MKACDRNSIKPFWKSVENLSLQNIAEGWDGVEQGGADHKNVFLGPRGAGVDVKKFLLTGVQLAQTPSGLSDRRALPLISDARCKHLISGSCVLPF